MHEFDSLAFDPESRAEWVHELRNAINTLGMSMLLAQRLLEKQRPDDAHATLAEGVRGWHRCQELLKHTAAATQLAEPPLYDHDAGASVDSLARTGTQQPRI